MTWIRRTPPAASASRCRARRSGLVDRRADGVRALADLARDDALDHRRDHDLDAAAPERRDASLDRASPLVGDEHVTSSMPKTKAGATCSNFEASARTTHRRDARRRARSVRISGTESFIRASSGLIAPMPMNSVSARSSRERQLGDVAEHRVHPRPDDAAEDDELDPGAVEQDGGDVERVGDDRQAAVDERAGEVERGRAARDEDRLVVGHARGGGAGDGALGGEVGVAAAGRAAPGDSAAPP